jgi:hypothetical protein
MDYFLIRDNKKCCNKPQFLDLFQKFDERALMKQDNWKIPYRNLLGVSTNEQLDFVDIISSPLFLLSKPTMKITSIFEPNLEWKQLIAVERKHEKMNQYFLPLLPWVDCLHESSVINQDRSTITNCCLTKSKIPDKAIFYLYGLNTRNVILREDLLEGLM